MAASGNPNTKLDPSAAFGQLLRKHRLRQKMSQETLAARAGYERAFISLIELGKTNPSLRSIFDICGSLSIKPSVFLREVEKLASFELPEDKGWRLDLSATGNVRRGSQRRGSAGQR